MSEDKISKNEFYALFYGMFLGANVTISLAVEIIAVTHDYVLAIIMLPFVIMSGMDIFSVLKSYFVRNQQSF
ncbi:hypothetical protein [Methylosinus sp. PW1]|uniref:hypothetical protein n=1 Tax=Methylosinus sp. PW1 TaxID=107636 RepID=UPI0005603EE4|nr:hypothetical protein [Methylosinus sp. PW1]